MNTLLLRPVSLVAALFLSLFLVACDRQDQAAAPPAATGPSLVEVMQQAKQAGGLLDPPQGQGDMVSPGSTQAVTPFANLKVERAQGDNSYTVGELFIKGETLDGQIIRIRGQVVKFSPAIMGRNFIHLQDGSGDPGNNSHNLVITSDATAQVGDVITIEGVLAANRDFGAGYVYPVIIEQSRVVE